MRIFKNSLETLAGGNEIYHNYPIIPCATIRIPAVKEQPPVLHNRENQFEGGIVPGPADFEYADAC